MAGTDHGDRPRGQATGTGPGSPRCDSQASHAPGVLTPRQQAQWGQLGWRQREVGLALGKWLGGWGAGEREGADGQQRTPPP